MSNLKITLQDLCIFCLTLEHKYANEKNKICDVDEETRMVKGEGMKRRMRNADKLEKKEKLYIIGDIISERVRVCTRNFSIFRFFSFFFAINSLLSGKNIHLKEKNEKEQDTR